MRQTAAALSAWLSSIIATGKMYDPAATFVGIATALVDLGQATTQSNVTEATGHAATRVAITSWSAPYPLIDGRWAVDSGICVFTKTSSDSPETITNWFLNSASSAGTLKAWGDVAPNVPLAVGSAPLSIVVRLTIDPTGRFDASIVWDG